LTRFVPALVFWLNFKILVRTFLLYFYFYNSVLLIYKSSNILPNYEPDKARSVMNVLLVYSKNMSVKITYFVHGTTTDNEAHISSGWYDVELSELGVQQSKELTQLTEDKQFDVVFCSDLKRAVDSATLTWGDKYKIIQDERLRECNYGDYNAKSSDEVEPLQEQSISTPMPNGESYEIVKERIASFLVDVKRDYDGKHIAIVGHKAPQLALDVLLKGMTWDEAFETDWRKTKTWQPGWEYTLN